jgi:hypothetical protein
MMGAKKAKEAPLEVVSTFEERLDSHHSCAWTRYMLCVYAVQSSSWMSSFLANSIGKRVPMSTRCTGKKMIPAEMRSPTSRFLLD